MASLPAALCRAVAKGRRTIWSLLALMKSSGRGAMRGALETGSDLRVFFDPDDPSRHHARPDGEPPPAETRIYDLQSLRLPY